MGPAIVLTFWAMIGGTLAAIAAAVLVAITALLTWRLRRGRILAVILAAVLPFACVAWASVIVIALAVVDTTFLDRDMGFGDAWYAPLPGGYRILMIDTISAASICRADIKDLCAGPPLSGVSRLQLAGPIMLGEDSSGYFLFDTRNGRRFGFDSREKLADAARAHGIALDTRPVYEVYGDYRRTWIDDIGLAAILAPPVLGTLLGFLWVLRLRRRAALV